MLYPLTLSSHSPEQAHVHTKSSRNPFPRNWSSHNVWEKSNLVFLKGEINPSSKQEKVLLHVMRQRSCRFLCLLRHDPQMGSSHLCCCMWLLPAQTISFSVRLGCPRCISASSWDNDYFSCWLLLYTTFGNVLLDLPLHTQKTLFSFTPLSLIPSNAWKHISMYIFCMQVCKTALYSQQCSHPILGGIKQEQVSPAWGRGTHSWEGPSGGGRQAAPEASGGPVFLLNSPWIHAAKRAETREGKHILYPQAAPKHFAEPFDPKPCVLFCCRAAIAPVGSATGAHLCPPRRFLFLFLSKAPVALCFLLPWCSSQQGIAFVPSAHPPSRCLLSLPFSIWSLQGWWTPCFMDSQVTTCAEDIISAFLFHLHKPEEIETKKYCTDHLGNPSRRDKIALDCRFIGSLINTYRINFQESPTVSLGMLFERLKAVQNIFSLIFKLVFFLFMFILLLLIIS